MTNFQARLNSIKQKLNYDQLVKRQQEITTQMGQASFWDKPEAQSLSQELSDIKTTLTKIDEINTLISDLEVLSEMLAEDELNQELQQEKQHTIQQLETKLTQLETTAYLSGPYDKNVLFSRFTPVLVVPKPWIGPRCCFACIHAI